ncbi:MAG: alpha/beta fold hydrolase [Flavobacteriales bacterium AspAUS03]
MILHSKIYGQGQGLLVLHGLFGMGDNWTTLGKRWAEAYQVHLVDLRNHGKSFHADAMDYTLISDDILQYIRHHELSDPVLIGHSIGGKAVMQFALNHPEIPQKIIISDIAPKAYQPHHQKIIEAIKAVNFDQITTRKELDVFLIQSIPDWGTRALLSKNTYQKEDGRLAFRFYLQGIEKNYAILIQQDLQGEVYKKPTLFLRGGASDYISDEDFPLIRKYFSQAQIITIEKSSHWIHANRPAEFDKEVQVFLKVY